ncbi:MAG: hypothetical protein JNL95_06280 [Chitinophagales bacterium]|nr:hypothetical protein [Chitinophagales bacterium]
MAYEISIQKRAIKVLQEMDEPYFSALKSAIYKLAENPRPAGCKKLKGREG